jgi:hypothetical protein
LRNLRRLNRLVPGLAVLLTLGSATLARAYEIGYTSMTFVDSARGNREVPVEVYYPADIAGESVPPAAPPGEGFPVVAFGHGYMIPWSSYDFLWESLSPAGFFVALAKTGGELFPDHLEFGQDLAFVSRALRAESSDPASLFYGVISQAAAVGGHSMGGGASFLAAAGDSTMTALFNLAAAETNPSAIGAAQDVTVPALVFSGSLDCVTPPADHQIPMYEALASECKTRLTVIGASHCQFAEYSFTCSLGEIGCADPTLTRTRQHEVTLEALTPWLRATLQDDGAAWAEFEAVIDSLPEIDYVQDCPQSGVGPGETQGFGEPAVSEVKVFPNPGRGSSRIGFRLAGGARVTIEIVSAEGRRVGRVLDRHLAAGSHIVPWNGRNGAGLRLPPGVYFFRLEAGGAVRSGRLVLAP